jgi:hypothetical protein
MTIEIPDYALDSALTLYVLHKMQYIAGGEERALIGRVIASYHRKTIGMPATPLADAETSRILLERGIVPLPLSLSSKICAEVHDYFFQTPCYNTHVPVYSDGILRPVSDCANEFHYGSYMLEENLRAPHLLELALDPRVIDTVAAYLNAAPSLYSINTFWTFPQTSDALTHDWHRDQDDYRFLSVFIYWTDVVVGEGEFYYIPFTHDCRFVDDFIKGRRDMPWTRDQLPPTVDSFDSFRALGDGHGYRNFALYENVFRDSIECVIGPAGSIFVSDTFGLHRGSLPKTRPRLVTWFRYGLYKNNAYLNDKQLPVSRSVVQGRIPDDERTRFVSRLILSDS